jgi:protein TonB
MIALASSFLAHILALMLIALPSMTDAEPEPILITITPPQVVEQEKQADEFVEEPETVLPVAVQVEPATTQQDIEEREIEQIQTEESVIENSPPKVINNSGSAEIETGVSNPPMEEGGDNPEISDSGAIYPTDSGDEEIIDPVENTIDLDSILNGYRTLIFSQIQSHKNYPVSSRRLQQEGTVQVSFVVRTDGSISGISVSQSSGYSSLDQAAIDSVNASSPLPEIPDELNQSQLNLTIALEFSLE